MADYDKELAGNALDGGVALRQGRAMKKIFVWALSLAGAAAASWAVYEFVCYEGRRELLKIAREKDFCKTDGCEEGSDAVHTILVNSTGASAGKIDWCIGVSSIAQVRVHRGGWLKAIAVDGMNYPCLGLFDK